MQSTNQFEYVPGTPRRRDALDAEKRYIRLARAYQRIQGLETYDEFRSPDVRKHEVELGRALLRHVQMTPEKVTTLHDAANAISKMSSDKVGKLKAKNWGKFFANLPREWTPGDASDVGNYLATQSIPLPPVKTKIAWTTPDAPQQAVQPYKPESNLKRLKKALYKPSAKKSELYKVAPESSESGLPAVSLPDVKVDFKSVDSPSPPEPSTPQAPVDVATPDVSMKIRPTHLGDVPGTPGPIGTPEFKSPGNVAQSPSSAPASNDRYDDPLLMAVLPKEAHRTTSLLDQYKMNGVCGVVTNNNHVCPGTAATGLVKPTSQSDAIGEFHDQDYKRIGRQVANGQLTKAEGREQVKQVDQKFLNSYRDHAKDGGLLQRFRYHIAERSMTLKHWLDEKDILDPLDFLTTDLKKIAKESAATAAFEASLPAESTYEMKMINKGRHYERQLQALETRFEAGDIDYDTYQREAGYIFDVIKTDDSFDNSPDKEKIMDALSAQKTRMDENARNLNFSEAELTPGQSLNFDDDSSVGDSASEISGLSQRDTALPVRNNAAPDTSKLLNEVKDAINGLAPKPSEPKGPFNAGSMGPRALTAEQVQQMEKTSELPSPPTPNDVMRLGATEANSALVIPRGLDQIRSDIEFDMFSVVRPGFGLGADNKMFAFENIRDKEIIGKGPLFLPRYRQRKLERFGRRLRSANRTVRPRIESTSGELPGAGHSNRQSLAAPKVRTGVLVIQTSIS